MTPRMRQFLTYMAETEPGKGLVIPKAYKHIAGRATSAGYGMQLGFGGKLMIFVINEKGRDAIRE